MDFMGCKTARGTGAGGPTQELHRRMYISACACNTFDLEGDCKYKPTWVSE